MGTREDYIGTLTPAGFLSNLCDRPRGLVVICNVLSGLNERLFDRHFVRQVFEWWHGYLLHQLQAFKGPFPLTPEQFEKEALDALNVLLFAPKDPSFRSGSLKPDFLLACVHKPSADPLPGCYCSVMDVQGLIYHLMSPADRRRLGAGRGVLIGGVPGIAEFEAFFLAGETTITLRPGSTLGKPHAVFWVTPTSGLRRNINGATVADRLRDVLGLVHFGEDQALAAIYLPTATIAPGESARPTFADAGGHRRFRARADRSDHRRQVTWGYAICLLRLASGKRQIDGRRERVSRPIPASRVGRARVLPLGQTVVTRGDDGSGAVDDDKSFAERLARAYHGTAGALDRMKAVLGL